MQSRPLPGVGRPLRQRRRGCRYDYRTSPTSDTAAIQVFRTLAVGRPAAALEPRAAADEAPVAADEAPAAQPLPAAGVRGLPAAEAREPAAAQDEAWEGPPLALGGPALPRASDGARAARSLLAEAQAREPLVQERGLRAAAGPGHAGLRPAAAPQHSASAPG